MDDRSETVEALQNMLMAHRLREPQLEHLEATATADPSRLPRPRALQSARGADA